MSSVRKIQLPDETTVDINDSRIHIYRSLTGTAAVTSSPYTHAKWDVTDDTVTQYVDGMVVCVKVPVAGHGTYGTGLQINSLGYKPIVYNVSSMISTRYSVGSVVWAVYNSTQTASLYVNSASASTITGCWQVMDYDTNTTSIYTLQRYNGTRVVSADLLRYVIAFRKNETTIIPIHSNAGTGTAANTAVTATTKTMTTESFDPFGEIYQYATNTKIEANGSVNLSTLRTQCVSVDARYIFNCAKTLTAQREIYLVVDLQSDGMVKLATSVNPWAQTLPSTNDGHLYILLGYAYSTYQMELYYYHPIYYHDGTQLRQYGGDKTFSGNYNDLTNKPTIPDAVSGVNDGTNWTSLTIGSTTKSIPQHDVLVCTYSNGSVDRTPQEIYEAKAAGKEVVCILGDFMYYLISVSYYGNDSYSVVFESTASPHYSPETKYIKYVDGSWSIGGTVLQKQLIGSGTGQNIKTINNQSLLGSGNITIQEGSSTLSALTDTALSSVSDGQVLTYDNATSKWINSNLEKEIFWCTMTSTTENNTTTWSCDKTWSEIYAAHQAGKLVRLTPDNDSIYTPVSIGSNFGMFSSSMSASILGTIFEVINTFIYDGNHTEYSDDWTFFNEAHPIFSFSDKHKLEGIAEGAEVNVQSDWDESDSTSDAYIANKPTIPTVPTNVSSFTNDAGYLTSHDFTHTANTTILASTTTITFAANTRGSQMITVSADIGITFAVNNLSDNYLWIANSGSADIDVTISAVTLNSSSVANVYVPTNGITVPASGICEIGIIINTDGAFITSRNDLAL